MRDIETVTLRELLPPSIASDPGVLAAADAIDVELKKTISLVPNVSIIPRIREIADSAIIDLLAWGFHCDFYDAFAPLEVRRELVAKSLVWHTRKGTPSVVEEVVTAALTDSEVTEWYEYGGEPYYFRISTYSMFTDTESVRKLVEAIFSVKNTRSWLESIDIITRAAFDLRFGAGYIITDIQRISLRSPDSAPYVNGDAGNTARVYVAVIPVERGHIITYAGS